MLKTPAFAALQPRIALTALALGLMYTLALTNLRLWTGGARYGTLRRADCARRLEAVCTDYLRSFANLVVFLQSAAPHMDRPPQYATAACLSYDCLGYGGYGGPCDKPVESLAACNVADFGGFGDICDRLYERM